MPDSQSHFWIYLYQSTAKHRSSLNTKQNKTPPSGLLSSYCLHLLHCCWVVSHACSTAAINALTMHARGRGTKTGCSWESATGNEEKQRTSVVGTPLAYCLILPAWKLKWVKDFKVCVYLTISSFIYLCACASMCVRVCVAFSIRDDWVTKKIGLIKKYMYT